MNKTKKVSFCGVISGLCIVIMMASYIIPTATYALPMIAGVLLTLIVIELGVKYGWMCYIGVSLLILILPGDIESKVLFIVFGGYYPIIKGQLERIKSVIVSYAIKVIIFNVMVIGSLYLSVKILGFSEYTKDFASMSNILLIVFVILANVVFVLYDIALTRIITLYIYKLRNLYFKKIFK